MAKIIPLGDRVLIKKVEEQKKEEIVGGIIIPADDKPIKYGEVVALAKDITSSPVKAGDKVIYKDYAGKDIEIDGEEFIIIPLKEIEAILETK